VLSGIDISNLQGPPAVYQGQGWYIDSQFVIVQAIPRPRPNGLAADQLRAAHEDGKKVGIYCWLWHDPSWRLAADVREDQLLRLATVPEDVALDMRAWLDVEDDQSAAWAASGLQVRKDDVLRALEALNEWSAARGLPDAGMYTSRYYADRLLDGWLPNGVKLWLASYGVEPGSLIGGDCVAHQYTSTPIDQDMMLESEIINPDFPGVPPNPLPTDCDAYRSVIERGVNRLQIELDRKTAASKPAALRRTLIREIQSELFAALSS